jgi:hypothetical protein
VAALAAAPASAGKAASSKVTLRIGDIDQAPLFGPEVDLQLAAPGRHRLPRQGEGEAGRRRQLRGGRIGCEVLLAVLLMDGIAPQNNQKGVR